MERRAKVELFEQMRREYRHGVGTIEGVARKFGVHRRMVRQALGSATPPERKKAERKKPKLGPVREFIERILEADGEAPRKQRHTAHRIWQRIREGFPDHVVAEATVRQYVGRRKRERGRGAAETCIPQSYQWGGEAQVDWYEAAADLDQERTKLFVFAMRSMAGGGAFHVAYRHATQQAFFEGHELAFRYFGGVFRLLRYDNLRSAVRRVLRGRERMETERFITFRSHWGFQSDFCNPARGNEKGGVEGELGYLRRNYLVPAPQAKNLAELNEKLLAGRRNYEHRRITGKPLEIGAAMATERGYLLPLPAEGFDLAETSFPAVDGKGCVQVGTNCYSTSLKPGSRTRVKLLPAYVEIWEEDQCVARHERCFGRHQQVLDLEHYLDALERKPGALAGSTPLKQWREAGRWPESFDRLWSSLNQRQGRQAGTRQMIELLQLGKQKGWQPLRAAVEEALALGCADAAAIRRLLAGQDLRHAPVERLELAELSRYERSLPELGSYDQLLGAEVAP